MFSDSSRMSEIVNREAGRGKWEEGKQRMKTRSETRDAARPAASVSQHR